MYSRASFPSGIPHLAAWPMSSLWPVAELHNQLTWHLSSPPNFQCRFLVFVGYSSYPRCACNTTRRTSLNAKEPSASMRYWQGFRSYTWRDICDLGHNHSAQSLYVRYPRNRANFWVIAQAIERLRGLHSQTVQIHLHVRRISAVGWAHEKKMVP